MLAKHSCLNETEYCTSGLKGHSLKTRTSTAHSCSSNSRGDFLVFNLSFGGRFLSLNLGRRFLAPGPSKLGVRSARESCAIYVQAYIPDTSVEGGSFLDKKLAEAVVPVIEVPGSNYLGENYVINMQEMMRGKLPGPVKG